MPNPDLTDAIPPDVLATDLETMANAPLKSRRQQDLEALEAVYLKRQEAEFGPLEDSEAPKVPQEPLPDNPDDPDRQLAAQLDDLAPPGVLHPAAGQKVRVKIDGVEQDVDLSDVLRHYQKDSAADRRLQEATRLLREAEQRSAQIAPPTPTTSPAPEPVPDDLKRELKQALSQMYEGNEEHAADQLADLLGRRLTPTPTPTPLAPAMDLDAIALHLQQRLDTQTILAKIQTDYPDILGNPDLEMLAYLKVQHKEAAGIPRAVALLESANEVYAALGKTSGKSTETLTETPSQREQKRALKTRLDTPKTTHSAAAQATTLDDESPSAVIAAIAAKRLGQSLPRSPVS